MIARHSLIRTRAGIMPVGVACLWLGMAMSPLPARAAGVFLPGPPSGFSNGLPVTPPSGFVGSTTDAMPGGTTGNAYTDGLSTSCSTACHWA